jgi:hypothetical protein
VAAFQCAAGVSPASRRQIGRSRIAHPAGKMPAAP